MPWKEASVSNVCWCLWSNNTNIAWVCAHLGFTVHTLCHYCGMVATATGNKISKHLRWPEELQVTDEGSTFWYKQVYSIGFL